MKNQCMFPKGNKIVGTSQLKAISHPTQSTTNIKGVARSKY